MFELHCGWLRYRPYAHFSLPEIVQVYDTEGSQENPVTVPFCDKSGNVKFTRKLYRLQWPGQLHPGEIPKADHWDMIPGEILRNLGVDTKSLFDAEMRRQNILPAEMREYHSDLVAKLLKNQENELSLDLKEILGHLPERLPASIAYHLAVNRGYYYPDLKRTEALESLSEVWAGKKPQIGTKREGSENVYLHSVGGLPPKRVSQILDSRFALDEHAIAALTYLKFIAEGHYPHPLLQGFDSKVQENLLELGEKATQLYFWLLQDYIYDRQTQYWSKADWKSRWGVLVNYIFWLGRIGSAMTDQVSGLREVLTHLGGPSQDNLADVIVGVQAWEEANWGRDLEQVGRDQSDSPSKKIVLHEVVVPLPECYGVSFRGTNKKCKICLKNGDCKTALSKNKMKSVGQKSKKALELAEALFPNKNSHDQENEALELMNLEETKLDNMIQSLKI